jgi:hypothetical protein
MSALAPFARFYSLTGTRSGQQVAIWKLLQHARALANGQSDAWAMPDGAGEDVLGLGEIVARIEQTLDDRAGRAFPHPTVHRERAPPRQPLPSW